MAPNGFFGDTEYIDVWLDSFTGLDEQKARQDISIAMDQGLLHRRFRQLESGKWHSAEKALGDIGLMDMCFGLLTPTFERYAKLVKNKAAANQGDSNGVGGGEEHVDGNHEGGAVVEFGGGGGDVCRRGDKVSKGRFDKTFGLLHSIFPTASAWYVLMRNILWPLQLLRQKHIFLTSEQFAEEERFKSMQKFKEGQGGTLTRRYPITVLASGILEDGCLEKIRMLFTVPAM